MYLKLLPRRRNSIERKGHVETVPVKLFSPDNSLSKKITRVECFQNHLFMTFKACILLGPDSIRQMTIDNEAYVALDLGAATLQAPILIYLD